MPCTKVRFYPLNFAIGLSGEMSEILEKKQKSPKNLVCERIRQIAFQSVRKYVFFSLRQSMVTFTVLFIFKRRSNSGLSGPREADVRTTKPILPPVRVK